MKPKKTRLVVDVPLHIKRAIHRVQSEAQETMLAFTDVLRLLEMAVEETQTESSEVTPLSPQDLHQIAQILLDHWQQFTQSLEQLQQRTRRWGDPNELELLPSQEEEQEDEDEDEEPEDEDEPLRVEADLDFQPNFRPQDLP
ncbi:hypothetical protein L6R29_24110 [Myxococcota bacterium]|nr:hypothetical protein [Myxococcota bacterium]